MGLFVCGGAGLGTEKAKRNCCGNEDVALKSTLTSTA